MANVTRYDPFSDIDSLFKGFLLRPVPFEPALPQVKIDVSEADGAYTVKADLPGFKKEDIQVDVNGNVVTISAETRTEKEKKKGERVIHSERNWSQVSRSFTLDQEVDNTAATAKYSDGVLELTLPKKAGGSQARITVQ